MALHNNAETFEGTYVGKTTSWMEVFMPQQFSDNIDLLELLLSVFELESNLPHTFCSLCHISLVYKLIKNVP
jgi:hypothetical protein